MINESQIVKEIQKDKHVRYFKLPEDNGWNSGRAVLISQVQTEYFVTCDDDYFFTDATRTGFLSQDYSTLSLSETLSCREWIIGDWIRIKTWNIYRSHWKYRLRYNWWRSWSWFGSRSVKFVFQQLAQLWKIQSHERFKWKLHF